jgi:hypothetical protein
LAVDRKQIARDAYRAFAGDGMIHRVEVYFGWELDH